MNSTLHYSSKSGEWETPAVLFNRLDNEFNFNLDGVATKDNALCENYFDIDADALAKDWYIFSSIFFKSAIWKKRS